MWGIWRPRLNHLLSAILFIWGWDGSIMEQSAVFLTLLSSIMIFSEKVWTEKSLRWAKHQWKSSAYGRMAGLGAQPGPEAFIQGFDRALCLLQFACTCTEGQGIGQPSSVQIPMLLILTGGYCRAVRTCRHDRAPLPWRGIFLCACTPLTPHYQKLNLFKGYYLHWLLRGPSLPREPKNILRV